MSAPDFYFAIHAIAKHIHDRFGKDVLIDYWRSLGREFYAQRAQRWQQGGPEIVAQDWRDYFAHEPGAVVRTSLVDGAAVLHIDICPAIKHIRDSGRELVPYFCEHCDHVCSSMAQQAGMTFDRQGGMGSCVQRFVPITRSIPEQ